MKKLISILIPTFNESDNVYKCYEEVKKELKLLVSYNHEIIFLDNRSKDDTFEKIKIICNKDSDVKAYRYSNNFGIQNSLMYGYSVAKGDAVIQIDCDLHHKSDQNRYILSYLGLFQIFLEKRLHLQNLAEAQLCKE